MKTYIYSKGAGGPIILWGMHMWQGDEMDKLIMSLELLVHDASYTLAAYEPENWDGAFSPWEASCDGQVFAGGGPNTLNWLANTYIPYLEKEYQNATKKYIAGYSLSGLFSLWSLYENSLFDGAASCSGSLWFPEWDRYISSHEADKSNIVYLSLGGKEKNSKSPIVSTIEDKTKAQFSLLNKRLDKVTLEMNPGGHFSNPEKRLAKGMAWLIKSEEL